MADVAMPRLSDSMEEGTILKWLKSEGDEVKRGEDLAEIETDKANMVFQSSDEGVLEIVAQEGDTLAVGETIARIGEGGGKAEKADEEEPEAEGEEDEGEEDEAEEDEGESEEEAEEEEPAEDEAEEEEEEPAPANAEAPSGDEDGRVKASPVARRMAREMGLDLEQVEGTGPGGRIVKSDIEAAARRGGQAEAPAAEAEEEQEERPESDVPPPVATEGQTAKGETSTQELSRLQQTVARRMAESKATAPDFVLTVEVDMEEAVELRRQLKAASDGSEVVPSFNDLAVKSVALALREFARANGAYRDGKFELYSRVNVGIAVAGQDALVVPTIFDADTKSLGQIAREAKALAERVRAGAITPPELSGGTFTISNLGMYAIRRFVAVINPPQAAILAVGALEPRAVVRDGEVVARHMLDLTLSCDHRILYGAEAAEFLGRVRERLERPLSLAL